MGTPSPFPNLQICDHPLIRHKLTLMRDASCGKALFRLLLREISLLMGYELTRDLATASIDIETPMQRMKAPVIEGRKLAIVPVLRAGLGMADGLEELIPSARIGHIGLYRDHDTKQPVEYLVKLPDAEGRLFIITDPMLATGHSARHAIDAVMRSGAEQGQIRLMSLVAAPEGVKTLLESHPEVKVYAAALDEKLDGNAYILPGLGDAGDRMFGTVLKRKAG